MFASRTNTHYSSGQHKSIHSGRSAGKCICLSLKTNQNYYTNTNYK